MSLAESLEIATCTDPGVVRAHNEDSIAADPETGLVVLADGMGGHNAGEVASGMATTVICNEINNRTRALDPRVGGRTREEVHQLLIEQIQRANVSIYQAAQSEAQFSGMGTTLVTALFYDNKVTVAHIGDSRMYRMRRARLECITRDHSLLQEQIDCGMITQEQARFSTHRNLVTRALGVHPIVEADLIDLEVRPDDIFLFCSDGLNDMVSDEDIELTLGTLAVNLRLAAQQLVQAANDNGGRDNVSVVLVRIKRDFAASRSLLSKLTAKLG